MGRLRSPAITVIFHLTINKSSKVRLPIEHAPSVGAEQTSDIDLLLTVWLEGHAMNRDRIAVKRSQRHIGIRVGR
jgi:hypothetical protein